MLPRASCSLPPIGRCAHFPAERNRIHSLIPASSGERIQYAPGLGRGFSHIWSFIELSLDSLAAQGYTIHELIHRVNEHKKRDQVKKNSLTNLGVLLTAILFALLFMFRPVSAAIAFRSVATVNNGAGSTTVVITKPTGVVANDVMIAHIAVRGGTGVTITPPAGWTLIDSLDNSTVYKSSTYYKVATGSEGSNYTFTFSISRVAAGIISAYSGVDTAAPINADAVQFNAPATPLTSPSVTTTVNNAWVIASYTQPAATTFTAGSGMTLRDQDSGSTITGGLQDVVQASAGATGTKTISSLDTSGSIGHTIALTPAPASSSVSQVAFRFFRNSNSTSGIGSDPMATTNTNVIIPSAQPFRLRMNLGVSGGPITSSNSYKLQYAARSTGDNSCDTGFSGETYADVGSSTPISFYTGNAINDASPYVSSTNDPTRSSITPIGQSYDSANPLDVLNTVTSGQDSLWDIALTTTGVSDGSFYCLRVVDATTGVLGSYTVVPQVSIDSVAFTQSNYRWFANANSTTPGAVLAAQDTAITSGPYTPIRLRQRIGVDNGTLYKSSADFKLQFAEKSGTCDTAFSGETYSDMPTLEMVSTEAVAKTITTTGVTTNGYWVNPSNAASDDGQYADIHYSADGYTEHLVVTGDPPAIPATANIEGFKVGLKGYYNGDTTVEGRLIMDGVLKGNSQYIPVLAVGSINLLSYGGSTKDLWGTTLTASDINSASAFGVELMPNLANTYGAPSFSADHAFVEIYYSAYPNVPGTSFYHNSSATDATAIANSGNDPTNARTVVYQRYQESQPFTNGANIPNGQDGIWDFSIIPNATAAGKTFCLRTVNSDGGLLNTYSFIPEITFSSAVGSQTRGGGGVVNGTKSKLTW